MIEIRPDELAPGPDGVEVLRARSFGETRPLERCDALVIHETVTRSAAVAEHVLRKRGLSVQLVVDEAARLVQHEPLLVQCQHAARTRNSIVWGVEVVNPYYPRHLRRGLPWTETIAAPWAHGDAYVLPTPEQAETVARLIAWAVSPAAGAARVPREWPGLARGRMAMGRVATSPKRGILAHTYFGHADGAWLVLYAWMRVEAGLDAAAAYAEARRRATGVKSVDVRDLVPAPIVA